MCTAQQGLVNDRDGLTHVQPSPFGCVIQKFHLLYFVSSYLQEKITSLQVNEKYCLNILVE